MITNTSNYDSFSSVESIIERYSNQYDNIDFVVIDENLWFVIRPITRLEYSRICSSTVTTEEKKDYICKRCILYPTNFDLENCVAGIPEQLYNKIMEISYLDKDSLIDLIQINRDEMMTLEHQMLCIIAKAFPSYKYEEIENMDMIQICKLFTRAEWMLKNLTEYSEIFDILDVLNIDENDQQELPQKQEEYVYENKYDLPIDDNIEKKPVSKMTEEQRQALDDFYKKFPEFDKSNDYAYTGKVYNEYKDPPALRTRRR